MKNFLLLPALFIAAVSQAQYYYNDIISTMETSRQMKTYVANKVKQVMATGFEPDGRKSSDFNEWQDILQNGSMLKVTTRNGQSVTRVYYRFDPDSRLISATDSSGDVISVSNYSYDELGRVVRVENKISDGANDFNQAEVHVWKYNSNGKPVSMWRSINNADSLEVKMVIDETGNPAEERMYKRKIETGAVYYYHDELGRLTDIVRYNNKARRLLPDYMFEYDDKDNVIQKITTTSSVGLGYIIWRYLFNEKGLKTKEALFNKEKQQTGRIEYAYTFL
jgi:hypothetical protein